MPFFFHKINYFLHTQQLVSNVVNKYTNQLETNVCNIFLVILTRQRKNITYTHEIDIHEQVNKNRSFRNHLERVKKHQVSYVILFMQECDRVYTYTYICIYVHNMYIHVYIYILDNQ